MLQNGTVISETMIDSQRAFLQHVTLQHRQYAQIASSQYGGQSISLSHLAPFVQISREKIPQEVRAEFEAEGKEPMRRKINKIAEMRVKEEIKRVYR